MAEFIDALGTKDLKDGQMTAITVQGKELLVARVVDRFYAASNICPHMGGKLARGSLKGTVVTCPRHASQFDLKDGRVVRWTNWSGFKLALSKLFRGPRPLPIYPTRVEKERVLVEI
jgi:3-phenylpropionate/trans-cinnamate dioxygenase ferredoxin subunit